MQKKINMDLWLSRIGLALIFWYCLLASIFFSYFAQKHVTFDFVPFPIFVGEIVMFICFLLLVCIDMGGHAINRRTKILLSIYFGWVGIRALINYHYDGPLTCRNAALFYYPIFAVFAYCFYKKARIPRKMLMSLAFLAAGILFLKMMVFWYWWTYFILLVIAVWNTKSVKWRWLGWFFLVCILLLGKEYLYKGPRAHVVSVFGSVVFLVVYFGFLLAKQRKYLVLSGLLVSLFVFIMGIFFFSDRRDIDSVIYIKEMISTYKMFDKRIQESKETYVPAKIKVQLYNPKEPPSSPSITQVASIKNVVQCRMREGQTFDLDEGDIMFRLFVWRDMACELIEKRAWWGFSFGHPQRSRSLEVLGWASLEWSRDGWIAPHNSFFHIIYRAGILGIGLVGGIFFMIGKLIKDFFNMNSVGGGLLVGVLIYWLILSNFFVILEFPYNAIIFWSLFGIAMEYRSRLKKILKGAH